MKKTITVAHGDGIGPEIMKATLRILEAAGAELEIETIKIGKEVYLSGNSTGIEESSWESLMRNKVFLKAPITTPFGGGYKSLNVTTRKTLGLFANVRPCRAYTPYVRSLHPGMDVVIIRENEEDLYAGIEHRQTRHAYQALKIITRPGSEKIIRYAFEYARQNDRKKVTCFVKDNIMKFADGIFHDVFDEVAKEYPEIKADSIIIDIGAARLADTPEMFDVIVTSNLYGDILSDIAVQISGSVGIGGSANIGTKYAMFEAIHGSAPDIAGKGIANPSGLLLGSVLMLKHIDQSKVAAKVQNAWLKTLEDGIHTGDIYVEGKSAKRVNTQGFCDALIERLGELPTKLKPVEFSADKKPIQTDWKLKVDTSSKKLVGVDVFLDWWDGSPDDLGKQISALALDELNLAIISNRGTKVWPNGNPDTFLTDHWRCRFEAKDMEKGISHSDILAQLNRIQTAGIDFIKTENLYFFDDKRGYTLAQGQ